MGTLTMRGACPTGLARVQSADLAENDPAAYFKHTAAFFLSNGGTIERIARMTGMRQYSVNVDTDPTRPKLTMRIPCIRRHVVVTLDKGSDTYELDITTYHGRRTGGMRGIYNDQLARVARDLTGVAFHL